MGLERHSTTSVCGAKGVAVLSTGPKPFILTTDWSQRGMGAVLNQLDPKGVEHPMCYASRSCNPAEQN